ncbi:pyridoxal phosphate-dependent transferase [Pseudomassariella vexata]|uniref:Pyridoxal phosphate-dependent transferase n=1 Tax=Pseudomassariella vexata TaxID=1141098 RepID=A0A1Y2E3A1_9PEZI|nr:pyridoxal phosphate-dependent transferase [Pseudomassariella vexata]ORY66030.1 pyridoxal phosphate-dependent transferase [Pseudomassariella vexata]
MGDTNITPATTATEPELVQGLAHEIPSDGAPNSSESQALATRLQHLSLAAQTIHADDYLNSHPSIAPPMHVSTTFRYNDNPDELYPWANKNPLNPHDSHIYSRDSAPNATRLEAILTSILHGPTLSYSSGLAAFHALLTFLNPRRIAIGGGYHGCHGVIKLMSKLTGLQMLDLDCPDADLQPGDVLHVETPLNPTGEARDLQFYAEKARRTGAYLTVDATFAPPPLLDPLQWGADVVMHSGTKYFGGHSDMLCGVLAVAPRHAGKWIQLMREERLVLGSTLGSLEGWLGLRSLRTLEVRVRKQSQDGEKLVKWLTGEMAREGGIVKEMVREVRHASLQKEAEEEGSWLKRQMPNGFGPVFCFFMKDEADAKRLPSKLQLFHHATSLGGVESLIEWRSMSDVECDKRLLRVSVGLEGWEDLRDDLVQAFDALAKEKKAA